MHNIKAPLRPPYPLEHLNTITFERESFCPMFLPCRVIPHSPWNSHPRDIVIFLEFFTFLAWDPLRPPYPLEHLNTITFERESFCPMFLPCRVLHHSPWNSHPRDIVIFLEFFTDLR